MATLDSQGHAYEQLGDVGGGALEIMVSRYSGWS
jgi:hypothetical protein